MTCTTSAVGAQECHQQQSRQELLFWVVDKQFDLSMQLSFCAAVLTTWLANRRFAFGGRTGRYPLWLEFTRYLGVCIGGGLVNLACYSALVLGFDLKGIWLVAAVAAGSLAGMAVNFTLSKRHVFAQSVPPRG